MMSGVYLLVSRSTGGTFTLILIDRQTRYLTAAAIMFVVYDLISLEGTNGV